MSSKTSASELSKDLSTQQALDFDYARLDYETRLIVQQHAVEIKSLLRQTAQELIGIGQKLIEVKGRLGHGNFGNWLEAEFGWGITTAWKLMKVAEAFRSSQCEDLEIAASAIYLLAVPSTPKAARQEALERARRGENITYTKAKAIIAQHQAAAKPKVNKPNTLDVETETGAISNPELVRAPQSWQLKEPLGEVARAGNDITSLDQIEEKLPRKIVEPEPPWFEVGESFRNSIEEEEASEFYFPRTLISFTFMTSKVFEKSYASGYIIDAVLLCLGEIDLSFCNNNNRSYKVPALTQYNEEGLAHPWFGRVFINLHDSDAVQDWADKLCDEFRNGSVTEALVLAASETHTQWFRCLRQYPPYFISGQPKFSSNDSNPFPYVAFYLGREMKGFERFSKAFSGLGEIFTLVIVPGSEGSGYPSLEAWG